MTVGELLPYSLQTYNSLVVLFFIKQVFLQVIGGVFKMKLNKKIIGLGLVAVAALGLAACARGGRGGSSADSKLKLLSLQILVG